jgi:hypothetical protein
VFQQQRRRSGSPFTVLAVSNTNDKDIAFAVADQPTNSSYPANSSYAYNPSGAIDIMRSGTGNYSVSFNGLSGDGGTVLVSALGSAFPRRGAEAHAVGQNSIQPFEIAGTQILLLIHHDPCGFLHHRGRHGPGKPSVALG